MWINEIKLVRLFLKKDIVKFKYILQIICFIDLVRHKKHILDCFDF